MLEFKIKKRFKMGKHFDILNNFVGQTNCLIYGAQGTGHTTLMLDLLNNVIQTGISRHISPEYLEVNYIDCSSYQHFLVPHHLYQSEEVRDFGNHLELSTFFLNSYFYLVKKGLKSPNNASLKKRVLFLEHIDSLILKEPNLLKKLSFLISCGQIINLSLIVSISYLEKLTEVSKNSFIKFLNAFPSLICLSPISPISQNVFSLHPVVSRATKKQYVFQLFKRDNKSVVLKSLPFSTILAQLRYNCFISDIKGGY